MKSHRFLLTLFAAVLFSFLPLACAKDSGGRQLAEKEQPPMAVKTAVVKSEDIERRVEVTGTLAPWEESTISCEVEGRVVSVRADLGDRVKKGQTLAQIAPEEYGLKAAQADAELTAIQSNYKRITELVAKDMVTQQQAEEEKRKLDVAQAAAEYAHKKLSDTYLRAPIDGSVAKRLINPGEYARVGQTMFQVVRTSPLKFRGDVPEHFTGDVKEGDPVTATLQSDGAEPLSGKIVRVGPSVSTETRSFAVEAEIDNADEAVKPGSFARVSILTATVRKALTIPETAVFTFAGNPRAFVADGGKAHERVIETEGKDGDRVLVKKGLSEGEKVVAEGVELLTDGRRITLREEPAE